MSDNVTQTAQALMRAVVASGCIRREVDSDSSVAVQVMREELKAFLLSPRYADQRELALTGRHNLAMASLAAECVARILKERAPMPPAKNARLGRHLINEVP